MTKYITHFLVLMTVALGAGCTMSDMKAPPLAGPSELSLSLTLTANPDVLSLDGSSQTLITVEARDQNGQLKPNVPLRIDVLADGVTVDYGTISARTLTTGSNGRASFTYSAPPFIGGTIPTLQLSVTPTGAESGFDASALLRRLVTVRLVPPGVIGAAPTARYTYSPTNPAALSDVRFDASTSTAGLGSVITGYVWDFGDNTSAVGLTATHRYNAPGTYNARVTVTDSNGFSNQSAQQAVVVGGGAAPTANFLFSPSSPIINQDIFFNGTTSVAGTGHNIVRYDWNFGDGATKTGATVTKSYGTAGTFNVVLNVTDESGQVGQRTGTVTVGGSAPNAAFTFSPSSPRAGQQAFFNASASTPSNGATIPSSGYSWNWGDGKPDSIGVTPAHVFDNAGTFTVTLTVTDSAGRTDIESRPITVTP